MTLDEISDAHWFLKRNPPVYAIVGDYFKARIFDDDDETPGSPEEARALSNAWRGGNGA